MNTTQKLVNLFQAMFQALGPQHWWPGDTPLEIMIGAVLTQNTNWKNVERAIENLKQADLMDIEKLVRTPPDKLAELIRPAGYFTVKTKRLLNLLRHIHNQYEGNLDRFFNQSTAGLREELLVVNGIGPETADDILLYAAQKPSFVVDTYTYRILLRHLLIAPDDDYQAIKDTFEANLPPEVDLYNEFHALLVAVGKNYCKPKNPLCNQCPLSPFDHNPNLPDGF